MTTMSTTSSERGMLLRRQARIQEAAQTAARLPGAPRPPDDGTMRLGEPEMHPSSLASCRHVACQCMSARRLAVHECMTRLAWQSGPTCAPGLGGNERGRALQGGSGWRSWCCA